MKLYSWIATIALLGFALPSQAQIFKIEAEGKTEGRVVKGELAAVINYQKIVEPEGYTTWKPKVQILLQGKPVGKLQGADAPFPSALVQIAELDSSNPYSEVLLSSFTGGAHCCNEVTVLTSDKNGGTWREVSLGPFNGGPDEAIDIDQDGRYEYVTIDNRFLYLFASYASSAAPTQIWQLEGSEFIDVSLQPRFKFVHQGNLNEMSSWFKEKPPDEPNGFLAAYVANKALVGELSDGWKRMLTIYDRTSDWGLTSCEAGYNDQGTCLAPEVKYQSYPEALRAFLIEAGYIKPDEGSSLAIQ